MPILKKCPDCGGKMERRKTKFITESEQGLIAIENLDADICTICDAEYLTAESDEYIEKIVEKIFAKKIRSHQETVFRISAEA
ncbi:MAG: YgiT-type zinc finger protein [Methanosarcinales archaeon]